MATAGKERRELRIDAELCMVPRKKYSAENHLINWRSDDLEYKNTCTASRVKTFYMLVTSERAFETKWFVEVEGKC